MAATKNLRQVQLDPDLWDRLGKAVKRADPDSNRSALLRRLARWYVGDIEEMPQRPAAPQDADTGPGISR